MRRKLITALMSGVLLGLAVLAVPQPTQATAGVTFYISANNAVGGGIGASVGCAAPDVKYLAGTGLNAALGAIYADSDFDSGDEIVLCDIDTTDGNVDYVMVADVAFDDGNFDDDNNAGTANAATLDLSDAVAPGSVTIRGDADDVNSIVIDANDGDGPDTGGYSPFDFTDANVTIEFLTILNAWDDSAGGAIHVIEDDSTNGLTLTLNSVVIEYAYAQGGDGAGAHVMGDVVITDSVFEDNATGGAPAGDGGAVYATGDVTITDSEFIGNSAEGYGGAVYVDGELRVSQVSVTDTIFDGNTSGNSGGAIYAASIESLTIESNQFRRNTAAGQGGAIRVQWGTGGTSITRNTFTENSAEQGGAVSINDGEDDSYLWSISRNTFAKNRATLNGGALHMALDNSGNVVAPNVKGNGFKRNSARAAGAVVVESDYGTELAILKRYERGLRGNSFQGNRATRERRSANIGVHFD
jgi:predicted outer membrane repeat protein